MKSESSVLRDFTVDSRVWLLSGVALIIGIGATFLAVLLLRLIAVSTNLFYYHRFSSTSVSPAGSPLGYWMVIVPVVGGLIVGLMARYGSDKIRGHGIPEAIEAILLNRARVDPKIADPEADFGGDCDWFGRPVRCGGSDHNDRRRLWLADRTMDSTDGCGANHASGRRSGGGNVGDICDSGGGDSSRGRAPALRAETAKPGSGGDRECDCGHSARISAWPGPLFQMPAIGGVDRIPFAVGAVLLGAVVGLIAAGMSRMMYAFEDLFERLPIHWMWWPALGGIGIGVGGLFFPRGLGVGYDNIAELLHGNAPIALILGILIAKSLMWAFSLGRGRRAAFWRRC